MLHLTPAAAQVGQHRASTAATGVVIEVPSQVRLSTGEPLGDSSLALYQELGNSASKSKVPASPFHQAANLATQPLEISKILQHKTSSELVDLRQDRGLAAETGPALSTPNTLFQPKNQQTTEKENLIMGLRIPRFNIIEAS